MRNAGIIWVFFAAALRAAAQIENAKLETRALSDRSARRSRSFGASPLWLATPSRSSRTAG